MADEKETMIRKALASAGIGPEEEVLFIPLSESVPLYAGFLAAASKADFYEAADRYRKYVLRGFADRGVRFVSFDGVVIAPDAVIGEGTLIHPGVEIRRGCRVGKNCVLFSGTVLDHALLGDGCTVNASQITDFSLPSGKTVGPFAVLNGEEKKKTPENGRRKDIL